VLSQYYVQLHHRLRNVQITSMVHKYDVAVDSGGLVKVC